MTAGWNHIQVPLKMTVSISCSMLNLGKKRFLVVSGIYKNASDDKKTCMNFAGDTLCNQFLIQLSFICNQNMPNIFIK